MFSLPLLSQCALIATATYPLRASSLPTLMECPGSVFLTEKFWMPTDTEDESGEAADTGNLVHSAAAAYHHAAGQSEGGRIDAGLARLDADRGKFPAGKPLRAQQIFANYTADPANAKATVLKVEQKVVVRIPCAPWDITGQPIYVRGTLDQLRLMPDGTLGVDDIKTGRKFYGKLALAHYMSQQAAYVLGAIQTWGAEFAGRRIRPGALICTDGYDRPDKRVFFRHRWTEDEAVELLWGVRIQVAAARQGYIALQPGSGCQWCPHKEFPNCHEFMKNGLH